VQVVLVVVVRAVHTLAQVVAMVAMDIVILLLVPGVVQVDMLVAEVMVAFAPPHVDTLAPAAEVVVVETVVVAV
jgi:hypothetical protein